MHIPFTQFIILKKRKKGERYKIIFFKLHNLQKKRYESQMIFYKITLLIDNVYSFFLSKVYFITSKFFFFEIKNVS